MARGASDRDSGSASRGELWSCGEQTDSVSLDSKSKGGVDWHQDGGHWGEALDLQSERNGESSSYLSVQQLALTPASPLTTKILLSPRDCPRKKFFPCLAQPTFV